MSEPIRFYSTNGEYGCFSNFSRHPITLDGKRWPTSEHYFQAQKFATTDPAYAERIRMAKGPMEAARMGRSRRAPLRRDWESVKDKIMRRVLCAKFTQYGSCRSVLLGTGTARIIEATPRDSYWGEGASRTGKNMLGVLLMELREALRYEDRMRLRCQRLERKR